MSRFQISLNVDDADVAVDFYRRLLGVEPAKHHAGYANFVVDDPPLKLVVIEDEGPPGTVNHLGVEHPDPDRVAAAASRAAELGLPVQADEPHTCCFATQHKVWTRDPDGVPWELYAVTDDTAHFGVNPHGGTSLDQLAPPITLEELRGAVDDPSVVVVDAQGAGGYERAHVPSAFDWDIEQGTEQLGSLVEGADTPIVLYCTDADCLGSEFVGTQLVAAGHRDVRRFPGGIAEWAAAGLPTEPSG